MDRNAIMEMMRQMRGGGGMGDVQMADTAETVYISSLALLKMLKHGRAGVPMEVMGLMLGDFVDDYTVRVVDVFAMPQSGTAVSVEAVDPVFQQDMMTMLTQTGRNEKVVGWYHSHPGLGCWLSGVDVNTSQSFEQLNKRSVAVVVDPIQSVKGKVVIDAFRCISQQTMMLGVEPRQATSVLGHLVRPNIQAVIHGLNRHYYSLAMSYRKNALETQMLMNLHKKSWKKGLSIPSYAEAAATNVTSLKNVAQLASAYALRVTEEEGKSASQVALAGVGKTDTKKRMEGACAQLFADNIAQTLGTLINTQAY